MPKIARAKYFLRIAGASNWFFRFASGLCLLFSLASQSEAAATAGQIELLEGGVSILDAAGKSRVPALGSFLQEGDTVVTGHDGELHAHMEDEGYIAVRPNARLKINAYSARADKSDNVALALLKGSIRSITGWVGKKNPRNYRIDAGGVATIGIRGTDHEPAVILAPERDEAPSVPPGAYDKVNAGNTYIQHPNGTVELGPNQAGFAPHDLKAQPRLLDKIPEFYRPTKNESRIERRHAELERQLERKFQERSERTKSEPEHKIE